MKVYAKILDPEFFDYRVYEYDIEDSNVIVDGGKEYASFNEDDLCAIKKMINDYDCYDYDYYYHGSIKAFLEDMLPKKANKKHLSPKEISTIKKALDTSYRYYSEYEEMVVMTCLSIIRCEPYELFGIRGCCQGEYAKVYAPKNIDQDFINYIEAIYFGTGNEIEIHDNNNEVNCPEDIEGYTVYTALWREEDIKKLVASYFKDTKPEDVTLWKFSGYTKTARYELV